MKTNVITLTRKSIALLSALMLALALGLAGCSSADTASQSSASSSASSSAAEQASTFTVTVSVITADDTDALSVANADFQQIQDRAVELETGATAYDALVATGVNVVSENSEYGVYVTSINDVSNGSAGSDSGWTYAVNGESPMESAGKYVLSEGDDVVWTFVTSFDE